METYVVKSKNRKSPNKKPNLVWDWLRAGAIDFINRLPGLLIVKLLMATDFIGWLIHLLPPS
jgi:hypothetical protein